MSLFKRVSTIALLAAIIVYLLQLSPYPGIFLMFLGGPLWPGLFLHVALIALFFEARKGKSPRILMLVPVLAYGGYYAVFAWQSLSLYLQNAELRKQNPTQILAFDPARFSLVSESAGALVQRYQIPHAYTHDRVDGGYRVYFLAPRSQCEGLRDSLSKVRTTGFGFGFRGAKNGACTVSMPAQPPLPLIETIHTPARWIGLLRSGGRRTTELRVNGQFRARFATVFAYRLSAFPFLMAGCGLNSAQPKWQCVAQFTKTLVQLDGQSATTLMGRITSDASSNSALEGDRAEAILLGLTPITEAQMNDFHLDPRNQDFLASAQRKMADVGNEAFDALKVALTDDTMIPPRNMGSALVRQPERLAPFAAPMAARFQAMVKATADIMMDCARSARPGVTESELIGEKNWQRMNDEPGFPGCWKRTYGFGGRGEIQDILAQALEALPPNDLAPHASALFAALRQPSVHGEFLPAIYPALYIRVSTAAQSEILKQDYLRTREKDEQRLWTSRRLAPVLAICRIGKADAQTIRAMQIDVSHAQDEDLRQALMVTLLKLGERDWVRRSIPALRDNSQGWVQTLVDGKGWNAVGPNNCMTAREPSTLGNMNVQMEPLLKRNRSGEWVAAR